MSVSKNELRISQLESKATTGPPADNDKVIDQAARMFPEIEHADRVSCAQPTAARSGGIQLTALVCLISWLCKPEYSFHLFLPTIFLLCFIRDTF